MFSITDEVVTTVWGLELSCWRSIGFWATRVSDLYFQSLRDFLSVCKTNSVPPICTVCLDPQNCVHAVSSRRFSPEFFLSARSGVTIFKWLPFQFSVTVTHQIRHPWQCCTEHHYPHFCNKQVTADLFPVLLCSFWVYIGRHPSSTLYCNPTCSNLIDTSYTNVEHIQYGSLRNSLIFLNNLVQIVSCTAWPSRLQLIVQVQIPIIIPQFSHPTMRSFYVHSTFAT